MAKALVLGGATGLLGQALVRVLANHGWQTESLGRQDGNLFDMEFLEHRLVQAQADVIFNTVAYTQVDAAEDAPQEALQLNRSLPDALARIIKSIKHGFLVHYSTDFVFSGDRHSPWHEDETPCPASVYGSTKLAGEQAIVQILPEASAILRTAWLFGPDRKNFVSTILNACQKKDQISVVHDQIGSPTYTLDLAEWSLEVATKRACGIWHAVNSGHASWCELAAEAISLTSCPCKLAPITSKEWPQKVVRPSYSVLDTAKLASLLGYKPRPWPQALRDYLFSHFQENS